MISAKIADKDNYYPNTTYNMETQTETLITEFSQKSIYSIEWEDIENEALDYNFYLDEIETFFREDFNENIID